MKKVIIFRDFLLSRSETFIQAQAEALREFKPIYAGLRPASLSLPIVPDVLMTRATGNRAKAAVLAYRLTSFAPRFHRALKAQHASLIHAHFAVDGATALRMRSIIGIPLIVSLHGYDISWEDAAFRTKLAGRRYLQQRPRLIKEASKFLCVSEAVREQALSKGFPAEKLVVHYTGIDCARFSLDPHSSRDPRLVLFVGRLVEMKGCEYLIRAMAKLKIGSPRLVIIGDGPLRESLEGLSRELSVNAKFLGTQPPEAVRDWLAKARILCVPSVTTPQGQVEGLGMVFLEAQAMGVPVVSSWSGGVPEAVADGKTGLLAPERDTAALAAHLHRFLTDDEFWSSCAERGRTRVAQRFDLRRQTARLEQIYLSSCEASLESRTSAKEGSEGDGYRFHASSPHEV